MKERQQTMRFRGQAPQNHFKNQTVATSTQSPSEPLRGKDKDPQGDGSSCEDLGSLQGVPRAGVMSTSLRPLWWQ